MQALGVFDAEPDTSPVAYLWPDNVPAWNAWQQVQTQWRVGMGGATGLDYAGVLAWLRELDCPPEDRRSIFAGIQACERATLDVWAEQREREQNKPQGPPLPGH